MARNSLNSIYINSFTFLRTNSSFRFLRSECLAESVSKTNTFVDRSFDRFEVFEGFDLPGEDMDRSGSEDSLSCSFVVNPNKIAV